MSSSAPAADGSHSRSLSHTQTHTHTYTHATEQVGGHTSNYRKANTQMKAWKRLTAEAENVAVHFISIALKQLGRHVHHLLQGLHL